TNALKWALLYSIVSVAPTNVEEATSWTTCTGALLAGWARADIRRSERYAPYGGARPGAERHVVERHPAASGAPLVSHHEPLPLAHRAAGGRLRRRQPKTRIWRPAMRRRHNEGILIK